MSELKPYHRDMVYFSSKLHAAAQNSSHHCLQGLMTRDLNKVDYDIKISPKVNIEFASHI